MPKGQKPAADLNGITSDKEKPYYTMDDFPAPTIVTNGKNISYSQMKPGDMLCDHSYHHGWVSFYVGKDSYGHEVVLKGHTDGTKYVVPTFEYWDIKAWAAEPKHSIRRR